MSIMQKDAQYIAGTYARFPVEFVSGSGATLKDQNGAKYIDFSSGIGVNSLGYCNEQLAQAVCGQMRQLPHISNLYYTQPGPLLAEKLVQASAGMFAKVFFCNSGAEANEGMIKAARKYSYDKYGEGRSNIITLRESFHGRTITTLAATGQDHFHSYFFPFTEGFRYVRPGDMDGIRAETDGCCAIMMEPIQGEGGVIPLEAGFVQAVAEHCQKHDILLLFDEIQTGIGRTGKLYGFQHYGVQPDIISLAKGLGGGLPIGAVLFGEKTASVFQPGDHGTTFGGNPICCAAGNVVLDAVTQPSFLEDVCRKGEIVLKRLRGVKNDKIVCIRGKGLMLGIELDASATAKDVAAAMLGKGLVALTAGQNTVRLLPPLTISDEELQTGLDILVSELEQL